MTTLFLNPSATNPCAGDTNSTNPRSPIVPNEFCADQGELKGLYKSINDLFLNRDDDETPVTNYAFVQVCELLEQSSYWMMQHMGTLKFPKGFVTSDEFGGIRIEFWNGKSNCVTVVIGSTEKRRSYLFVKRSPDDAGILLPKFPTVLGKVLCNSFYP